MIVVAFVVFSILYLTPGDPALILAGDSATPEMIARIRESMGLDQPMLIRFAAWFFGVLKGDLGQSIFFGVPVLELIGQRLGPTLALMILTMTIAIAIAVPLGVFAAGFHGSVVDRAAMIVSVLGFSIPVFVIGYVLAYVLGVNLRWLPIQGYVPLSDGVGPFLSRLILPSMALSAFFVALIARMTRSTLLDVLDQDFIRTARAKGVSRLGILFLHALKNAAVPVATVIGISFAMLVGGAVVIESVFAIPGIGSLTVEAIQRRDYPVIQGVVLVSSFSYVLINLTVDLLYAAFDPRIRY